MPSGSKSTFIDMDLQEIRDIFLNCFPFRSRQSSGFLGSLLMSLFFFEKIPLGDVESEVIMIELSESEIMDKSD